MNKNTILTIARKDMKATFSSKKVWVPMIIVALIICIVVPTCIAYFGIHFDIVGTSSKDIEKPINAFIKGFPSVDMRNTLAALPSLSYKFVYFFLTFMMIPFFLMVAIINSMVTSSNSFVGEKERNTLETLLFAPISITDLFLGKVLASLIPTLGISFAAFIVSFIIVNVITYPYFEVILYFNSTWMILMFWVIPLLVMFNIILNVLISAKVKTFQEAQQFGGLLVLPIVGIIISQASGLFFLSPFILFLIGAGLLIANLFLIKLVTKFNNRNTLFQSQIH
ncbi:ABC-type Na+ efflux pump permease subunit [Neobacillus niacini]|uniref:ABC transporter permease subunit n=1 Tax=Neobacillus niacini TaxID=86668 RepID=UPI001043D539|nr:ABC transporter permease subunit [Neobacillus niacini]MDR7076541.1 ABC-type Na+ efflux pump permease subunit [Neobacillus niacini]